MAFIRYLINPIQARFSGYAVAVVILMFYAKYLGRSWMST